MPKFKDPKTGQIVNVNNFLVFLSCLLFGLFFFLYIGETQHALVMVGFGILIALVAVFIDITAVLFALIFPIIYSFIAPKIVKDKWLNKGYVESNEYPKLENYTNEKAIEAYNLSLEILNHAPNKFKKGNSILGVSRYQDENYDFIVSKPDIPMSWFISREYLLANKGFNPIKNNILRIKLDSNFNIVKIYNDLISDTDILKMKEILGDYQN